MTRDDAVAPVVAVMLILAVIVTFLSIWNAVVIPSMKQSSEIEHLRNVESAFQHFSSDIEKAVSLRQDGIVFSEPVPLGGGEVMFDSLRSSGSLHVMNGSGTLYNLTIYDKTTGNPLKSVNGTLVNITYEPLNNYWQDQGYTWQYGYINVTKSGGRQTTPLSYGNMTDVSREMDEQGGSLRRFAGTFGTAIYTANLSAVAGNCSSIDLYAINISASPHHRFVSSNGFGTLKLISRENSTVYPQEVSEISFGSGRDPFGFGDRTLWNWNTTFSTIAEVCDNNVRFDEIKSRDDLIYYSVNQDVSPVRVSYNIITIEVGAY